MKITRIINSLVYSHAIIYIVIGLFLSLNLSGTAIQQKINSIFNQNKMGHYVTINSHLHVLTLWML